MNEFVEAYINFLAEFKTVDKPTMPNFDISAYTDNEYLSVINLVNNDFMCIDDLNLTLRFLKGD